MIPTFVSSSFISVFPLVQFLGFASKNSGKGAVTVDERTMATI